MNALLVAPGGPTPDHAATADAPAMRRAWSGAFIAGRILPGHALND
jgi:hypothetical protein